MLVNDAEVTVVVVEVFEPVAHGAKVVAEVELSSGLCAGEYDGLCGGIRIHLCSVWYCVAWFQSSKS